MPVPIHIRNGIIERINDGISYTKIIEWVKEQGYSISRGGISYIKTKHEKEKAEQKTKQNSEQAEQKKKRTKQEIKQKYLIQEDKFSKFLTKTEFNNFEKAVLVITKSNYKRYLRAKAFGMLSALDVINETLKIIKERGKYN